LGHGTCIVLSERGKRLTTNEFCQQLKQFDLLGQNPIFIIGNAFGFEEAVEARANLLLSLSAMTMAHELVLVNLMEQLYRCHNLLAGGQYHK